jgi:hypothetical protein
MRITDKMGAAGLEALAVAAVELYQGCDITDLSRQGTEALERAARLYDAQTGESVSVPAGAGLESARRWVSDTLTEATPGVLYDAHSREDGHVDVTGLGGREYLVTVTEK